MEYPTSHPCSVCNAPEAKLMCNSCSVFKFCSNKCADHIADAHARVCFDHKNKDTTYIANHLRDVIADMKSIHQDRYDAQEISDALDVLVDLPHTKEEAISLIQEHLMDYAGELVFADLPKHMQSELTDGHAYPVFHLKSLAYDRIEAGDSDLDAAKEATRAAELTRAAEVNENDGKNILERSRARARRVEERAARAAALAKKRAMRKEKEASRLRKRAGAAKQRGDARSKRILDFGKRRAERQKKISKTKEARAAKKREAARRALNSSSESE